MLEHLIASEQRMRVAETRARSAEGRLRDAIDSMNEGFTAYDAKGQLVLASSGDPPPIVTLLIAATTELPVIFASIVSPIAHIAQAAVLPAW